MLRDMTTTTVLAIEFTGMSVVMMVLRKMRTSMM